ncbi:MAG: site-specific DNA-methyltransferase [Phycisphaerales bacterium]|nr:site-specific DNA-methyltransferase [Phycisphaerales bacterium]
MARKPRTASNGDTLIETTDYRHAGKRKNIPSATMERQGTVPKVAKAKYHYNPHLPPELRFDPAGGPDRLPTLIAAAQKRPLTEAEAKELGEALKSQQPWLEWAGKKEEHDRGTLSVNPVALHLHERISAKAIVRAAMRQDVEQSLFAAAEDDYAKAVQFYKHDVDWSNRLIMGDSLEVMSSLARREGLGGKVQMIYMDPPYGINYASNFQPEMDNRQVKDNDADLTREPEMVRAYRDTWHLGVHSYLSYVRDRLVVAKGLLAETGSILVQISTENLHVVRQLLDEVFGPENFAAQLSFRTKIPLRTTFIAATHDFALWYARDKPRMKYHKLFSEKGLGDEGRFSLLALPSGERRYMNREEKAGDSALPEGAVPFVAENFNSAGRTESCVFPFEYAGRMFEPTRGKSWKTNLQGMTRLLPAERLFPSESNLYYVLLHQDYPVQELHTVWNDTRGDMDKAYVVQTATKVIERCMLMTTDPGDLVLDPTCGSGTTAYVAEQWGRRWITTDTSRVAIAIARQRLLTAKYDYFRTKGSASEAAPAIADNPGTGFIYKTVPHITLKSIAQNPNLDPIFAKHEPILDAALDKANAALKKVTDDLRKVMCGKLAAKAVRDGLSNLTDADDRRWLLPGTTPAMLSEALDKAFRSAGKKPPTAKQVQAAVECIPKKAEVGKSSVPANGIGWEHWQVPFDADDAWPRELQEAVVAYRTAWRAKMDEVNGCIAKSADQEELVDQPQVVKNVTRVSGPFTVEGVIPEEMALTEDGIKDLTPNEDDVGDAAGEMQNIHAYLKGMVDAIRTDGLTFPNNKKGTFAEVTPLYEGGALDALHAEGFWSDDSKKEQPVAIAFGPQYGPITARQVEDCIHAATRYRHLVLAGFSFAPEAAAIVAEQSHPKLKIHLANIRPDMNESMKGLLKETPNSQLFSVFGLPEIEVTQDKDGKHIVTLKGVDIFDPVENTVRSTGASKVAAWFLDSDFDNRCFCTTQAFFPNQDAWGKIAKALGSAGNEEVFEAFKGTESLPFEAGEHKRVAVKVIDPRGNEVMTVRKLS